MSAIDDARTLVPDIVVPAINIDRRLELLEAAQAKLSPSEQRHA